MYLKITRKELKDSLLPKKLWKCGHCSLQNLLKYEERLGYNQGIYGWNWDAYKLDDFVITTGYRSMPGNPIPYDIIQEFESKAKDIHDPEKMKPLINDFLKVLKNLGQKAESKMVE